MGKSNWNILDDIHEVYSLCPDISKLEGKSILVTGSSGMLGSFLVDTLLQYRSSNNQPSISVTAVTRQKSKLFSKLICKGASSNLNIVEHEFKRDNAFPKIQDRFDYVIHAASNASPRFYGTDPFGTIYPNVGGFQELLDASRQWHTRRVLFVSSSEVYGTGPAPEMGWNELSFGSLNPNTVRACYAESKRLGETLSAIHARNSATEVVIVRPFHTYGPMMSLDDGRVFADFVRSVVEGRPIQLTSTGTAKRAFCYVTDCIAGMLNVLFKGENGEAYNIGNPNEEYSISKLAELISNLIPGKTVPVLFEGGISNSGYIASTVERNFPDVRKLLAIGWKPTISVPTGFTRVLKFKGL